MSATWSGAATLRANRMMPPRSNSRASDRRSAGISWPANPAIASWPTWRRISFDDMRVNYSHSAASSRTGPGRHYGYNPQVYIESSAPTRIDLAGGTLDIWPLYLFHDGAQTLN